MSQGVHLLSFYTNREPPGEFASAHRVGLMHEHSTDAFKHYAAFKGLRVNPEIADHPSLIVSY